MSEIDYRWLFMIWSKSKIKSGEKCVYSLILQAKGVKQPFNVYAEIGNEIHSFLEDFAKVWVNKEMKKEDVQQLSKVKNSKYIDNFIKIELDRIENVGSVYLDAEHYIEVFIPIDKLIEIDEDWKHIKSIVEHFVGQSDNVGLILKGFIDRVDEVNGDKILIDYKTGNMNYVDMDEMWFYSLLWWLKYNEIPKMVILYGLKDGTVKYDFINKEFLEQYYKQIIFRIKRLIISIIKYFEGKFEVDKKECKKCWWNTVCDKSS